MHGTTIDPGRAGQARTATVIDGQPLSQREAAERLLIHPVTLNKIENGKANVSLELLERMSRLYGRSREWLCGQPEQIDPVESVRDEMAAALAEVAHAFSRLADATERLDEIAAERVKAAA